MKLGKYVEVVNFVDDTKAAGAYYAKLGLTHIANNVYTDGRYHLRVEQGDGANPTVRYYGCDLDALKADGLDIKEGKLKSPTGLVVEVVADAPPLKLPHDDITRAPDTTRLGKFGELSVMCDDLEVERKFWEQCGYIVLGDVHTDEAPWGIWTDDMYVIGIHQYGEGEPFSITHFDPNMKAINKALMDEGFPLDGFMGEEITDKANTEHATLMTPYGLKFYLFTGDITRENP